MVCHKPARRKNIRTNESSDFVFGSTIVKCTKPVFDGIYGCLGSFADASATAVGAAAAGAAEKDQTIGHKSRCCPCLFGRFAVAYGLSFFRPSLDQVRLPHELAPFLELYPEPENEPPRQYGFNWDD